MFKKIFTLALVGLLAIGPTAVRAQKPTVLPLAPEDLTTENLNGKKFYLMNGTDREAARQGYVKNNGAIIHKLPTTAEELESIQFTITRKENGKFLIQDAKGRYLNGGGFNNTPAELNITLNPNHNTPNINALQIEFVGKTGTNQWLNANANAITTWNGSGANGAYLIVPVDETGYQDVKFCIGEEYAYVTIKAKAGLHYTFAGSSYLNKTAKNKKPSGVVTVPKTRLPLPEQLSLDKTFHYKYTTLNDTTFYWVKIRSKKYLVANEDTTSCNETQSYDNNTQFYFIDKGDGIVQVKNKAFPEKAMYVDNFNDATPAKFGTGENCLFQLRKTNNPRCFELVGPETDAVLNDFGEKGALKIWVGGATHTGDAGNMWELIPVPDDYAKVFKQKYKATYDTIFAKPYHAQTFGWTEAYYNKLQQQFAQDTAACKQKQMSQFANDVANPEYIWPESGYYRLKNKLYSEFLAITDKATTNAKKEANTIIKLTNNGDGTFQIVINGKHIGNIANGNSLAQLQDAQVNYEFIPLGIGYNWRTAIRVKGNQDAQGFVHRQNTGNIVGWGQFAEASQWTIEPATDFELVAHLGQGNGEGKDYATLYVPFAVNVPEGVTAYVGKTFTAETKKLTLEPIEGGVIPAGTAVVLERANHSDNAVTVALNTETEAAAAASTLKGTYTAMPYQAATQRVFGLSSSNKVGFFSWDGAKIPANRAYFEVPEAAAASAKAIELDFDQTTGISNLEMTTGEKAPAFDLQGRRVTHLQKGQLYIVNGKKVIL